MVHALKPAARPANRQVFARRTERRVLDYVRANRILAAGESVIVAASGGPDSTALLAILHRLARTLDIRLTVAHFNHRLRALGETAADLQYVARIAAQLGIPLVHGSGNVRGRARKRGETLEDAARILRYAFLARAAKKAGGGVIVTGHNLNDQAETVLLHIARGTGLGGLAGIRPRSGWPFGKGPALARPLLCVTREDIERYCRETGLEPRSDETNEHLTAIRNRIRLRVLPELEAVNPRIARALARLASASAGDADYLDGVARETFRVLAAGKRRHVTLRRADLHTLPAAIASRVILAAIERVAGTSADIEMTHVASALALAETRPAKLSLPNRVSIESDSSSIHIYHGLPATPARVPETTLPVPGVTRAGPWEIRSKLVPRPEELAPASPWEAHVNLPTAARLTVRARRPGDRLHPLGLAGQKKLQDILVDAKVPDRERDGVPIICDEAGILWVVGHCLDERARVREDAREVLHITARKKI